MAKQLSRKRASLRLDAAATITGLGLGFTLAVLVSTLTSVFGPDGGIADALATALVVSGREGARWFLNPELAQYGCWGVDRNSDSTWSLRWPERQIEPK